jgi:uncharacterized membrane protein YeaQ/YmgE (transglycosylase-associated protein family)
MAGGAIAGVFAVWLLIGVLFGLVASNVWSKKGGSSGAGFALGFFLGVIGLVIAFLATPSTGPSGSLARCPFCAEGVQPEARVCKHCGRDLPIRRCPHCDSQMVATATRCPHCRKESDAWMLHEGRWWKREGGASFWFDDDTKTWTPQR